MADGSTREKSNATLLGCAAMRSRHDRCRAGAHNTKHHQHTSKLALRESSILIGTQVVALIWRRKKMLSTTNTKRVAKPLFEDMRSRKKIPLEPWVSRLSARKERSPESRKIPIRQHNNTRAHKKYCRLLLASGGIERDGSQSSSATAWHGSPNNGRSEEGRKKDKVRTSEDIASHFIHTPHTRS